MFILFSLYLGKFRLQKVEDFYKKYMKKYFLVPVFLDPDFFPNSKYIWHL